MTAADIAAADMNAGTPAAEEKSTGLSGLFMKAVGGVWDGVKWVAKTAFNFAVEHPIITTIGVLAASFALTGGTLIGGLMLLAAKLGSFLVSHMASAAMGPLAGIFNFVSPAVSAIQTMVTHPGMVAETALNVLAPGAGLAIEGVKTIAQHPEIAVEAAKAGVNIMLPGVVPAVQTVVAHPEIAATVAKTAIDVVAPGVIPVAQAVVAHPDIVTGVAKTALNVAAPGVVPVVQTVVEHPGILTQAADIAAGIAIPGYNYIFH